MHLASLDADLGTYLGQFAEPKFRLISCVVGVQYTSEANLVKGVKMARKSAAELLRSDPFSDTAQSVAHLPGPQDLAALADKYVCAEARARLTLLGASAAIVKANRDLVSKVLPKNDEARDQLVLGLVQLKRRCESDLAMIEAALARIADVLDLDFDTALN